MAATIYPAAQALINRLAAVNAAKPRHDKPAIERAITAHLKALGQPARPFVWAENAAAGYALVIERAWDAAWYAARCALESVAWYRQTPRGRDLGWYLFSLRRAEYCRERYSARWGIRAALPKIRKVSHHDH